MTDPERHELAVQQRVWWRSGAMVVTVVAIAYSLVVTFPLVLHLDSYIYGYPGDATGTVAIYSWWEYAARHGLSIFDNTAWGAPYGAGWATVAFTVIETVVFAPLSALFGGAVAYNLEVLSSFPLTAWTTYLLARRIGARQVPAAFAALAFAFIPYHLEKAQGHSGQTHMEFFSATLLFLVRWRQGGSRWNLAAAGAMAGLTLWNDFYFAFIMAFLVATFFVASWLHGRRLENLGFRRHLGAAIIVGLVTLAFAPIAVLAVDRPGSGAVGGAANLQNAGVRQSLVEVQLYSSRPWEYFLPFHANPLVPKAVVNFEIGHLHGSNFTEQTLFLGYTVMVLGVIAVVSGWRRFEIVLLLALGLVGAIVSLPPGIHLHGFTIPLPSLVLNALFPIFRVYARFAILVMLGAALLAGLGLTVVQNRLHRRHAWVLAIPFVMTAIEFNNIPPTHTTQLYPPPAEYQWLAHQPQGILVEYPLDSGTAQNQEIDTRQYTLYQQWHGHPIFNGASPSSHAFDLYPSLEPYYGYGVVDHLRQIGVRYVFVHRDHYARNGYRLPQDVPGMFYVETLDGVDIYTIT